MPQKKEEKVGGQDCDDEEVSKKRRRVIPKKRLEVSDFDVTPGVEVPGGVAFGAYGVGEGVIGDLITYFLGHRPVRSPTHGSPPGDRGVVESISRQSRVEGRLARLADVVEVKGRL